MPRNRLAGLLLLIAISTSALAQPCDDCQTTVTLPSPEEGTWLDEDQPGTGFLFEIHNQVLLGSYFGFDAEGQPLWWLFNGPLTPSDDPDVLWQLSASLQQYQGGACLGCDHQAVTATPSPGQIQIDFTGTTAARVTFDDLAPIEITPLLFGVSGQRYFQPLSDLILPDLTGQWALVISDDVNQLEPVGTSLRIEYCCEFSTTDNIRHFFSIGGPDFEPLGDIECLVEYTGMTVTRGPLCELDIFAVTPTGERLILEIPLDQISATSFVAEDEQGNRVDAKRLEFN